jgi:hypothetical protein
VKEIYARFYHDGSDGGPCVHGVLGGNYCRKCRAMAVVYGNKGCGCARCRGEDLAPEELEAAKATLAADPVTA